MGRTANISSFVDFENKEGFDSLIRHYHNFSWEKHIICPCRKDFSSQPKSNCLSCKGKGILFFGSSEIEGMIANLNQGKNFFNYTEDINGSAYFTTNAENKVGWYDKIICHDGVSKYSQSIREHDFDDDDTDEEFRLFQLWYPAINVEKVLTYDTTQNKAVEITDYELIENFISIETETVDNISVLYTYKPTFLVIDVLNDWRAFKSREGILTNENPLGTIDENNTQATENVQYPLRYVLKRMHLVLDYSNFSTDD